MTKQYRELLEKARVVESGWRLAKYTFTGVNILRRTENLTRAKALQRWTSDLKRDRFSASSARRYYEVWDRYENPVNRERSTVTGEMLSFAEHYAIVRGGAPARTAMEVARVLGKGTQRAVQRPRELVDPEVDELTPTVAMVSRLRSDLFSLYLLEKDKERTDEEREYLREFVEESHLYLEKIKRMLQNEQAVATPQNF